MATPIDEITKVPSNSQVIRILNQVIKRYNSLGNLYQYKGSVQTYDDLLAIQNPAIGDVYNVVQEDPEEGVAAGSNFAWNGTEWDNLGMSLDGLVKKINGFTPDDLGAVVFQYIKNITDNDGTLTITIRNGESESTITIDTGKVKTVNGEEPDETGNISIEVPQPTIATQAEAEAGTDNTKFMTPLRTKEAINSQVVTNKVDYGRDALFTTNKTTVTIPKNTTMKIDTGYYTSVKDVTLQLSSAGQPSELAGKNVYIYACQPTDVSSTEPVFVLSLNSTVPTGYSADNSRKIGGFHCLCLDVGTISGHTLSGYITGDILPASVWDLIHRPKCKQGGMIYLDLTDTWHTIYGLSWDGTNLVSVYNGIWADGTSSKKWHGEATLEQLERQNMRLDWRHEFQMYAKGSNEQTNIKGSADPNTTGGHTDTTGRRMISNYGAEDCCGVMWQWTMDLGFAGGSDWNDSVYNSQVDDRSYGRSYGTLFRLLVGGRWDGGSGCGSRSVACNDSSAAVYADRGARGASEPLYRNALNRKSL